MLGQLGGFTLIFHTYSTLYYAKIPFSPYQVYIWWSMLGQLAGGFTLIYL